MSRLAKMDRITHDMTNIVSGRQIAFVDPSENEDTQHRTADASDPHEKTADTEHQDGHGEHTEHIHEVPNLVMLVRMGLFSDNPTATKVLKFVEPTFFSLIVVVVITMIIRMGTRKMTRIPGRAQNLVEFVVEGISGQLAGIMGSEHHARRHAPFLGALFLFIWVNNLMGIVPFMKAPTSMFQTTFALGVCTFFYVQFHAIRMNGPWGYVHHLMGSPKDVVGWMMSPLLLALELLGELIKPVSLALRLFGNILGEDILLYVFAFIGITMLTIGSLPVPVPLQFPFFFLALLTSTVQALVFTLLATIYVTLFIPHGEGH